MPFPSFMADQAEIEAMSAWDREEKLPIGAMFYATWMEHNAKYCGNDGRSLCVMTPGGIWMIDMRDANGGRWARTGTAPNVTVTPSIKIESMRGKYHGFLQNGLLTDDIDRR